MSATLAVSFAACSKKGGSPSSSGSSGSSAGGVNVSQTAIDTDKHSADGSAAPGTASTASAGGEATSGSTSDVGSTAASNSGSSPAAGSASAPAQGSAAAPGSAAAVGSATAPASGTVAGAPAVAAGAPAAPVVEEHGCFDLAFKHVPTAGHSDNESCARHRNVVTLKHKNVNLASVCVRVGKTPVKFDRYKPSAKEAKAGDVSDFDRIVIGTYAGPHTQVNVRYCLGKDSCNEDCKIPKDEFMAAIGAREDDGGPVQLGHWQKGDDGEQAAKLNSDLKRSLASFEESGAAEVGPLTTFKGWESGEAASACGK